MVGHGVLRVGRAVGQVGASAASLAASVEASLGESLDESPEESLAGASPTSVPDASNFGHSTRQPHVPLAERMQVRVGGSPVAQFEAGGAPQVSSVQGGSLESDASPHPAIGNGNRANPIRRPKQARDVIAQA